MLIYMSLFKLSWSKMGKQTKSHQHQQQDQQIYMDEKCTEKWIGGMREKRASERAIEAKRGKEIRISRAGAKLKETKIALHIVSTNLLFLM